MHHRSCAFTFWMASLAIFIAFSATSSVWGEKDGDSPAGSPGKKKIQITKLDELPQHTYVMEGKVKDLVKSREQVLKLAGKVRESVEADLATYQIDDATTLQGMYGKLLTIDLLEKKYDDALARLEQIRELEDKEAAKLTTGLSTKAMIAARRQVGAEASEAEFKKAFRGQLSKCVAQLPWGKVEDVIQENKGRLEIYSENLLMGIVQAQIEPVVSQTGELSADQASSVIRIHYLITERLPLKDELIAVYQKLIDANKVEKPDIWAARSVTLSDEKDYASVLMGAWDSGTDCQIFQKRLWVNRYEKKDGKDTDGNGFVDDIHGIAFDIYANRTTGMLCPLGDTANRIDQVMAHMKGFMDLQSAVDSPEATTIKKHLSNMDPAQVQGFIEDLGLAGSYAHGTHVAGIMVEGNPFAKLLIARLSYDHRMKPVVRDLAWGKRDAAKCRDTVEYFKKHGVRVVNMSWGEAQQDAEDSLERSGVGKDAQERREIARKVFALQKEGLYQAIKNAPDILFVCAAGNSDNDVEFDEYIASSFDLPNLLVVGAVDQAGEPTSFTSTGKTVRVYASGFEVESYIPGGQRMKMSGTSMASPNVANLAGKILALKPALTPPEVIALIKKGADSKTVDSSSYRLINPQQTLQSLK